MVKRRSFEDGLTADEEAFLKQGRVTPPPRSESRNPRRNPNQKKRSPT